jgi:hypothetical protein
MDATQVAYELWCLQEDQRRSGQPPGRMEAMIQALHERQPELPPELIQQGVAHFLALMFREETARSESRQRQIFHVSLSVARSATPYGPGRRPRLARNEGARTFARCAKTGNNRYNGSNNPTLDRGRVMPAAEPTEPLTRFDEIHH